MRDQVRRLAKDETVRRRAADASDQAAKLAAKGSARLSDLGRRLSDSELRTSIAPSAESQPIQADEHGLLDPNRHIDARSSEASRELAETETIASLTDVFLGKVLAIGTKPATKVGPFGGKVPAWSVAVYFSGTARILHGSTHNGTKMQRLFVTRDCTWWYQVVGVDDPSPKRQGKRPRGLSYDEVFRILSERLGELNLRWPDDLEAQLSTS